VQTAYPVEDSGTLMSGPEEWRYDEGLEMLRVLRERISTETDPEKLKLLSEQCERIIRDTLAKKPRAA
jgi:hypothetical protein